MAISKYCEFKQVPRCCNACRNLEFDSKDEYSPNYYFCTKGLFLPVKKQSCKTKLKDGE